MLSLLGFLRFHQEKNPIKLWLPSKSSFLKQTDWLMNTFQKAYRPEEMIITAPDILTPEVLNEVVNNEFTLILIRINVFFITVARYNE